MRILVCCGGYNSFQDNKVTIFALDQAKALRDYGHDVRICAGDVRSIRRFRPWGRWSYELDGIKVYTANFPCGPLPSFILRRAGHWVAKRCYELMKQDGWVPDVVHAHFLGEADAYVDLVKADGIPFVMTEHSSSLTETFGLVYAEAMSQGLPVLYSQGQGFDGQFAEGEVGYHVDSHDPADIAEKIKLVCQNYDTLSSNGPKLASKFKWGDIAKEYTELYERLAIRG